MSACNTIKEWDEAMAPSDSRTLHVYELEGD